MYLNIQDGNTSMQYTLTESYTKPYIKVNNESVLPLITDTSQGLQLKVQINNQTYRGAVYSSTSESASYLTSSSNKGGMSNTTALTSVKTTSVETLTSVATTGTAVTTATRTSKSTPMTKVTTTSTAVTTATRTSKSAPVTAVVTTGTSSITATRTSKSAPMTKTSLQGTSLIFSRIATKQIHDAPSWSIFTSTVSSESEYINLSGYTFSTLAMRTLKTNMQTVTNTVSVDMSYSKNFIYSSTWKWTRTDARLNTSTSSSSTKTYNHNPESMFRSTLLGYTYVNSQITYSVNTAGTGSWVEPGYGRINITYSMTTNGLITYSKKIFSQGSPDRYYTYSTECGTFGTSSNIITQTTSTKYTTSKYTSSTKPLTAVSTTSTKYTTSKYTSSTKPLTQVTTTSTSYTTSKYTSKTAPLTKTVTYDYSYHTAVDTYGYTGVSSSSSSVETWN